MTQLKINPYLEILQKENSNDSSHGITHITRVWKSVQKIANGIENVEKIKIDYDILMASTFLHDLVNLPKNHPDRKKASTISAQRAVLELEKINFPIEKLSAVEHAISAHSFSAEITPETIEAKILQDADRMDAIGAIGIARCFYISGKMGSEIYNHDDPSAKNRELDDKMYALDHFKTKLFELKKNMQTRAGRNLAEKRYIIMKDFVNNLNEEID